MRIIAKNLETLDEEIIAENVPEPWATRIALTMDYDSSIAGWNCEFFTLPDA